MKDVFNRPPITFYNLDYIMSYCKSKEYDFELNVEKVNSLLFLFLSAL